MGERSLRVRMSAGAPKRIGVYELLEPLGSGSLGTVYRARHTYLDRIVALKVLHDSWNQAPEFVDRFREEGRLMALLEHPNILRVYDAGQAEGVHYLAMGLIEGQTLERWMKGPLPAAAALAIVRQLLRALGFAHRLQIIHRDVKPSNVMLSREGHVTLMDFGVARLLDSPDLTLPGTRIGTPFYMAPEQVLGKRVDPRADLYATGIVLYQLLSGLLPFPGPSTDEVYEGHIQRDPPELPGAVPHWLRRVLWKALAKAPAERFPHAEAFLEALSCDGNEAVLTRLGVTQDPRSTLPPADTRPADSDAARPLQREDRSALSLDVIESSRMKQPGLTLVVHKHFAQFRTFVRDLLDEHGASHFVWSGDGILALFPRPSQGCACAAAILDGLVGFNDALGDAPGFTPIRVRIGVHHGPILMSEDQALGEVFSRTLDTAGHLQKASTEDSALISEPTYYALPDTRGWKRVTLDGSRQFPFSVYRYAPESRTEAVPEVEGIKGSVDLEVGIGRLKRRHRVQGEVFIGRPNPSASWTPQIDLRHDDAVSRRHARIYLTEQGFALEDLKSANGTSHNGKELDPNEPVLLHPGDVIELGDATVIRVLSP